MKHSQTEYPEPGGFGFARSQAAAVEPGSSEPAPLSENDLILASSALQEASALHGQPEYDQIAERFRAHADQSRLGLTSDEGGGGTGGQVDGAVAREELRIKAHWEGRLQALKLVLIAGLTVTLAWSIWENRVLKMKIGRLEGTVQILADSQLKLSQDIRSIK